MSDNRPLWMPPVSQATNIGFLAQFDVESLFRRTGIQAQIAAYEAMLDRFNYPGGAWFGAMPEEKTWVKEQIAALRKELGG